MTCRKIWPYGAIALLAALLPTQAIFAQPLQRSRPASATDFIEYWAAGRLLVAGGDPYSPGQLGDVQASVTARAAMPLIMWNPPWTLFFIFPFGRLSFAAGQFLWLLLHVFLILFSAQGLWRIYSDTAQGSYTPWLLAITFIPTCFALILGQITPLILAGLASFLYFERKHNGLAAGACAVLVSIKPQLCYLFWLALAFWVWRHRLWRIIVGASIAGLAIALVPALFDPGIYSSYVTLCMTSGLATPLDWAAPTLGNALRVWIAPHSSALQFVPIAVGIVWLGYYWQRHKDSWNWTERLPILLLVSVSTSAYAWTFDQIVLLPALMQSASWIVRRPLTRYLCGVVTAYVVINTTYLAGKIFVLNDFWYFWMAPLLLLAYLLLQMRCLPDTAS